MNNIQRIQEALCRKGLDAILLTDEKNQRYATGFPFTDGAVLVGREKAWLLTDSRYIEAAEKTAGGCCAVQMFDRERSLNDLLRAALKDNGFFVLTDYFAESEEMEKEYFRNLKQLRAEQGLPEDEFFHYDTPLTADHEIRVLRQAGFSDVQILKEWGTTFTLLARC